MRKVLFNFNPMHILLGFSLATMCLPFAHAHTLDAVRIQGQEPNTLPLAPQKARQELLRTPGGVDFISAERWRHTQAATVKDILDYTPGVFVQPKWGADSRLSIRGSGLSRYYHLRGLALYQDGIPLNAADGSADFQWIDPTAYQYTEVYKGANALRYGANTLGGAINFITPSGHELPTYGGRVDVGGDGWRRLQAQTGLMGESSDGAIQLSWQRQDGYREQSAGNALRANLNYGWQLQPQLETRFYVSAARVRQEIPGTVSKESALSTPRKANSANQANNWQHNIDGVRLANRTIYTDGNHHYEGGIWYSHNNLHHPIYQYLHHKSDEYGAYGRYQHTSALSDERENCFTLGLTWQAGKTNARNLHNIAGKRGEHLSTTHDSARSLTAYAENDWELVSSLHVLTGLQAVQTQRKRKDLFNSLPLPSRSGKKTYHFLNPKLGMLWEATNNWQLFANLSRSSEAPTFGDMQFAQGNDLARLKAQHATTLELGTRGNSSNVHWDVALYRAQIRNQFQCISAPWDICSQTTNIPKSTQTGIEAGLHWNLLGTLLPTTATHQLWLNTAYSYTRYRFKNDAKWGNNDVPGLPRHFARSELVYRHATGWYAGPNIEWVPSAYYADNANRLKTKAYAIYGARLGYENKSYAFYIEGKNLSNKHYISSVSTTDSALANAELFEPGIGRSIFAGVTLRF